MPNIYRKCPCCQTNLKLSFLIGTSGTNGRSAFICSKCHSPINQYKKLIVLISIGMGILIGKYISSIVLFLFPLNEQVQIIAKLFAILILFPAIWTIFLYYILPLECKNYRKTNSKLEQKF